jgi:chromosome segregation ATPase
MSVQSQLKTVKKKLTELGKQLERLGSEAAKFEAASKKAAQKKATRKKAVKKTTAKKTTAKKTAAKKTAAGKPAAKKKAPAKKAPAKKGVTVLDKVYNAIKGSRKGVTISQLKTKTQLDSRQLSNALYKLSKKGMVYAKSRGVYVKK